MELALCKLLGILLGASFALLLSLSRRPSASAAREHGEGYYVKERVTGGLLVALKGETQNERIS